MLDELEACLTRLSRLSRLGGLQLEGGGVEAVACMACHQAEHAMLLDDCFRRLQLVEGAHVEEEALVQAEGWVATHCGLQKSHRVAQTPQVQQAYRHVVHKLRR